MTKVYLILEAVLESCVLIVLKVEEGLHFINFVLKLTPEVSKFRICVLCNLLDFRFYHVSHIFLHFGHSFGVSIANIGAFLCNFC